MSGTQNDRGRDMDFILKLLVNIISSFDLLYLQSSRALDHPFKIKIHILDHEQIDWNRMGQIKL